MTGTGRPARRISAENKFTSYFWPGSEVYDGLEFIDQNVRKPAARKKSA